MYGIKVRFIEYNSWHWVLDIYTLKPLVYKTKEEAYNVAVNMWKEFKVEKRYDDCD